jgi:hypothetical protein
VASGISPASTWQRNTGYFKGFSCRVVTGRPMVRAAAAALDDTVSQIAAMAGGGKWARAVSDAACSLFIANPARNAPGIGRFFSDRGRSRSRAAPEFPVSPPGPSATWSHSLMQEVRYITSLVSPTGRLEARSPQNDRGLRDGLVAGYLEDEPELDEEEPLEDVAFDSDFDGLESELEPELEDSELELELEESALEVLLDSFELSLLLASLCSFISRERLRVP